MQVGGRHFSPETIDRINAATREDPAPSRHALSLKVCEWLGWRAPNGRWQEVSCRKALLELHHRGVISLPEPDASRFQQPRPRPPIASLCDLPSLACRLDELGEIRITPVSSRYSRMSGIWNGLMDEFHYLGKGPLCGAQIRYLIESSECGWLGGLAFSAGTWHLRSRDEYVGWTEAARRANIHRVVCNSRFLIRPNVQVPNLASHVLSQSVARLADDWINRYGYSPALLETFVDPSRFSGTCYRAANWLMVGQTLARTTPFPNGKVAQGAKQVYLLPISSDWQTILRAEPNVPLCSTPRPEAPAEWTEEEFGTVQFCDERLKQRLFTLAADFFAQPRELVPQACSGSEAKTKAAYRFFRNRNVNMQTLLRPHTESTITRIRSHPVILAVQDTTTLNLTGHPPVGAGPIGTRQDKSLGFIVHDTMAFTPEGTPLGLLDVQCWARDPEEAGKSDSRHELDIEDKESIKWLVSYRAVAEAQKHCPDTTLISVGDREADIYELFYEASKDPLGPKLLVRAERTRNRKADQEPLWKKMGDLSVAGILEVKLPLRDSRAARIAKLEVRFANVELSPPRDSKLPPLRVWAVYAREVGDEVKEPIDWMVLTTVPTKTFEQACERLTWYSRRWGIEVYHRVIKSGCRIEDRQLPAQGSLEACLAIDLVVGWRVYWLTMAGRETPSIPCDRFLSEEEWCVLTAWATGKTGESPPAAQQATRWIGKLGG
jgi:hypothetical protein